MFEECKVMRPLSANIPFHGAVVVKTNWVKTIINTFRWNLTPWLQMVWNQAQNKAISNETKLNLVRKRHKKFQLQKKIWYFINFLVRLFGFHLFKLFCAQSEPKMFETETKLEWSNLLKKMRCCTDWCIWYTLYTEITGIMGEFWYWTENILTSLSLSFFLKSEKKWVEKA